MYSPQSDGSRHSGEHSPESYGSRHHLWHSFPPTATIALAVSLFYLQLGPMAHFGVRCVVFHPHMHVLIVTYHAPTPEAAHAGPLHSSYQRLCNMIAEGARKRTKLLTLQLNRLIILLDAGTRRAAKSEPISVFVRGDNGGEIFVGFEDMVLNDSVQDCDLDAANAAAYDVAVEKIFRRLDIPRQWLLDRLVGVVSDGATVMGSYVARWNAAHPSSVDPIVWIRDAAHGLMRSVAHGKAAVRTWYKALDLAVSLMCIFYRTSSKRMRGLGRHAAEHCLWRRMGVRRVEAMGRELTIVLQNLDAALKHLPEYISPEGDAQRKAKATELLAALLNNLFRVSTAFFADVLTIVCSGSKLVQANRGVTIDAVRGLANVMCSHFAHLHTHVFQGVWESRLCVDPAIGPVRGSRMLSQRPHF